MDNGTNLTIQQKFNVERLKRELIDVDRKRLEEFTIDLFISHLELENSYREFLKKHLFPDLIDRDNTYNNK